MWSTSVPVLELALRAAIIYIFLLLLMRLGGKRQIGQLAPYDLVMLLIISNALQNAMNGGDESLTGGFVLAGSVVALNSIVAWLTSKSRRLESLVDGQPRLLIWDGKADTTVLNEEKISDSELATALREAGCFAISDARIAVLETNGRVSVLRRGEQTSAPSDPGRLLG